MNRIIILSLLLVSVIITGCHKVSTKEILKAKFENDIYMNMSLSLTSDNFYSLKEKRPLDTIENTYTGKYRLKNDTVYFSEEIPLLKTQKAILKNNSVDFNNGVRFLITQTSLKIPSKINLSKHSDIAVFQFNPELYDDVFDKNSKPYDLNEKDIKEIVRIFNSCPTKEGLLNKKHYKKQCIAVINAKGEKEVWVNCTCEKSSDFQYKIISVSDGGPCYMNMKINLTTHQCYDVHFNGQA
jgi:hypothetical protein